MKNKVESQALITDLYEFTMSQAKFNKGKGEEIAYFDLFFRSNPFQGGYTISGGLDNIIEYLKDFHFEEEDINYLREDGRFTEEFLTYLKDLKFTGDLYGIPDGTPVFPNEPIITVRAPIIQAFLIESAMLSYFNHGSLITTAAKRIVNAANGVKVLEFGLRRGPGPTASIEASKCAYIAGCAGTSNVKAAQKYQIPDYGTMSHAEIQDASTEKEAFLEFAEAYPNASVFLADTYDTLRSGVPNTIAVSKEYLEPLGYRAKGIRIDSGDLSYLSKAAHQMFVEAGYEDMDICLSNGLDEFEITRLIREGAYVTSFGCGDNIVAPKERMNGVYKLVAKEENNEIVPKIKVSGDTIKTTTPGFKKVYRFFDYDSHKVLGDVVALHDEMISKQNYTLVSEKDPWKKLSLSDYYVKELQQPIFKNGELVYHVPTIEETRAYCSQEFATLTDRIKDIYQPHTYYVDPSDSVREMKQFALYESMEKAATTAKEYSGYQKRIKMR